MTAIHASAHAATGGDEVMKPDRMAVQCNVRESCDVFSAGARVYLGSCVDGVKQRHKIVGRSRSGRWVYVWVNTRLLHNFRTKTIPADNPRYDDDRIAFDYWDEDYVARMNRIAETDVQ